MEEVGRTEKSNTKQSILIRLTEPITRNQLFFWYLGA